MTTLLKGSGDPIEIDPGNHIRIIGERINPSGRSQLRQALLDGNWDYIAAEARSQVEAGAEIIDVNVGGKGIDEVAVLPQAVQTVAEAVDVPLAIDTRLPAALEAALKVCPERPLVNSIGGERKVLAENLPIVAEHRLPVIVLCMDQHGIPKDAEGRIKVAGQVLEESVKAGVQEEDVIFDPLVLTVVADDQAAFVALETIKRLRQEFPRNNITGGTSNVSFGMPDRPAINAGFLTAAAILGMNLPITDPTNSPLRTTLMIADILNGRDQNTRRFMRFVRQKALNHP